MGLLLIKPAELLLFSTGADTQSPSCVESSSVVPLNRKEVCRVNPAYSTSAMSFRNVVDLSCCRG